MLGSTSKELGGTYLVLGLSVLLIVGGSGLAWYGQTAGGTIDVRDVEFEGAGGTTMSGTLYVPPGATAEDPAPGILAVHGYVNSKETQSPFAIEFARRGFVVLAIDQTGHGYSDPPAFANGFGGPAGLEHLRSLPYVDAENVGMEGHSMGGWAILHAAAADPDGYDAMVLEGSSTGSGFAPEGNASFPRNLAVVFSEYDEFAPLMWGVPAASDVERSETLQAVFGTNATVEEGRTYGSVDDGTARRLYTPATTHPGDHLSRAAVGNAVAWMQLTLDGEDPLPPHDQIWFYKELGTGLALLGGILFVFPFGRLLLGRDPFVAATNQTPAASGMTGRGRAVAGVASALVPVVTYFPLTVLGQELVPVTAVTPQQITNGIVVWALGNALVIAALFGVWHYRTNRGDPAVTREQYGLTFDRGTLARSLGVAVLVVGALYLLELAVVTAVGTDFRFWVVALKPFSTVQSRVALGYVLPFTAFFVALGVLLHGQLRPPGGRTLRRAMLSNWAVVVGGFGLLLAVQYVPLLMGRPLPLGIASALMTIVAIQFVVVLSIASAVSTYFFHRTGRIWVGAFVNGLFVTWFVVASTATHYPF